MTTTLETLAQQLTDAAAETHGVENAMTSSSAADAEYASALAKLRQREEQMATDLRAATDALKKRDAKVRAELNGYDDALDEVRTAVSNGGGYDHATIATLKDSFSDSLRAWFEEQLGDEAAVEAAVTEASETALRTLVREHDSETETLRTAKDTDFEAAEDNVATLQSKLAEARAHYEAVGNQLLAATSGVRTLYEQLRADRAAFESARDAGDHGKAVVHLQAYIDDRSTLTGSVKVHPDEIQYDVDSSSSATTLLSNWTAAKSDYETALSEWYAARIQADETYQDVLDARHDAARRDALRLEAAAERVNAAIEQAKGDDGDDGDTP